MSRHQREYSHARHIHVDATRLPTCLRASLCGELGFTVTNFVGHPPGYRHFEPMQHLTKKVWGHAAFDEVWGKLEGMVRTDPSFVGYIEGERIVWRQTFESRPFDHTIPFPYQLTRRCLAGVPSEPFRQREFHLTLDREASDPLLLQACLEAGLYGAYPDKDYPALVLTAQGSKFQIPALARATCNYLLRAGGAVRAVLKEEVAIRHALIGVTSVQLPEVVDHVSYLDL